MSFEYGATRPAGGARGVGRYGGPAPDAVPPRIPRPVPAPRVDSPVIARLVGGLERADSSPGAAVVDAFWRQVGDAGSPIVEESEHDDEVIATFVWRGVPHTRTVLALVNKLTDRQDLARSAMRNVAGTDVWWLAYRLPADWRGSYQFAADTDANADADTETCSETGTGREEYLRALSRRSCAADPRNPHRLPQADGLSPKSVAAMPAAPSPEHLTPGADVPRGSVDEHEISDGGGGRRRRVWVYSPHEHYTPDEHYTPQELDAAACDADRKYPMVLLLDGDMWFETMPIAPTLDSLIARGVIEPTVVVGVDAGDRATRSREMTCHEPFVRFILDDLVPWVQARWPVTSDPQATIVAGQSLGGLAAAYLGYRAPHRFGAVLVQSASFWWRGGRDDAAADDERMTRLFREASHLPLRWYVEVGRDEWVNLPSTRGFVRVLGDRGYRLDYREFSGGHDRACWRVGIADGLMSLIGREPIQREQFRRELNSG